MELVNLDPESSRTVIVQAGAFAEHTILAVRYTACGDPSWVGDMYDYGHAQPAVTEDVTVVEGPWVTVELPASTQVRLILELALRTRTPSYRPPFDALASGETGPGRAS